MTARTRMTMRADVVRDVAGTERDRNNMPIVTNTRIHTDLACYTWPSTERLITSDNRVLTLAVHQMIAPLDADLQELDRVLAVRNRRGSSLYPEMEITSVLRRETHLELNSSFRYDTAAAQTSYSDCSADTALATTTSQWEASGTLGNTLRWTPLLRQHEG